MRIIKVLAINSTNLFLKELYKQEPSMDNCCVVAEKQTAGKGQMGASWETEPGKNLTFSVLLSDLNLAVDEQFKLSALVAMTLVNELSDLGIENLSIKWPNDILAGKQKICGVLIENVLSGNRIKAAIVGVGLNVNQTNFEHLPQASSIVNITGKTFDLEELLSNLIHKLEEVIYAQLPYAYASILSAYHQFLFMLDKPATFELKDGSKKTGMIKKVGQNGKLHVFFEEGNEGSFDIKEIKLLY